MREDRAFSPGSDDSLSRAQFKRVLHTHFLPDSVIATKTATPNADWKQGTDRDVLDPVWLLSTDDRTKRKDRAMIPIRFDAFVEPDTRLTARHTLNDDLTQRLICITALTTGLHREKTSAVQAMAVCSNFAWFVRWKRSIGVTRTSHLQEQDFKDFSDRLYDNEVLDFVPIYDRLDELVRKAATGSYTFPVSLRRGYPTIVWKTLAGSLGVPVIALTNSSVFQKALAECVTLLTSQENAQHLLARELATPKIAKRARAARTFRSILQTWEILHLLTARGLLTHDPLTFDPFKHKTLAKVASEVGRGKRRTQTIPPQDFLVLLNQAAKWVGDFGAPIVQLFERLKNNDIFNGSRRGERWERVDLAMSMDATLPAELPRLWPSWRFEARDRSDPDLRERLSIGEAIQHLMTACAILIAGFGARRSGEVTSLRSGCIMEEAPGVYEMSVYIEKTLRDVDRIPVPALVKVAVELLERLTASTRHSTGRDWLFELIRDPTGRFKGNVHFNFIVRLKSFVAFSDLPASVAWDWSWIRPHQLRRAFAVCYCHAFEASRYDALSRMLRHFDPRMTELYITEIIKGRMSRLREQIAARVKSARGAITEEQRQWMRSARTLLEELKERGASFAQVRCEALSLQILQMWEGVETPIGLGTGNLRDDLDTMVRKAEVTIRLGSRSNNPSAIREHLLHSIEKYVETSPMVPVPGASFWCQCRTDNAEDLSQAECLKAKKDHRAPWSRTQAAAVDTRPDHSFSGSEVCAGCQLAVAFQDGQRSLDRLCSTLELAALKGATPTAREIATQRVASFKARRLASVAAGDPGNNRV